MHHWVGVWRHKISSLLLITDKNYTFLGSNTKCISSFERSTLKSMDQAANNFERKPYVYPQLVEWDYESTSNGESS